MARYTEPSSGIGGRIQRYRKSQGLTLADLADRYHVSGPAVFKFEKGFVTPSLKVWEIIAADMGIPEKEAILMWVKEKIPKKYHSLIRITEALDMDALAKELEAAAKGRDGQDRLREAVLGNPRISPSLKKFVSKKELWSIFGPSAKEMLFLVELDEAFPLVSLEQFSEALLVARRIKNPSA